MALFNQAVGWLRRNRVLPGMSVLAKQVASVRQVAEKRLYATVAGAARRADASLPADLVALLGVPEGRRVSELERLRRPPTRTTGASMAKALERVLTAGLFVLLRWAGKAGQRALGLFLAMVGMLIFIAGLPAFLTAAHLPAVWPQHHVVLLRSIQLAAAVGTLIWFGRLVVSRKTGGAARPLTNVFLLLAGLLAVTLLLDLLNGISTLSDRSTWWLAGLFLLTVAWSFITSGDTLTGKGANTSAYPRDGRILLSVSCTLIANAILLYLGSLRVSVTGAIAAGYLTADFVNPIGLGILGTSLVVLAFIVRTGNRAPARQVVASRAPRPAMHMSPRAIQLSVLGGGALITALALVVVAVRALPLLAQASTGQLSQTYLASVPGPDCDTGGATWSVAPGEPISTRCLPAGLQIEGAPGRAGDVQFLPPNGTFTHNYRVLVRVNLSHLSNGCADIYTRATAAGHYTMYVCTDNTWGIGRIGTANFSILAHGSLEHAGGYTIGAISDGSNQRITINGAEVASVSDTAFQATSFIDLAIINLSQKPGSVVFSDFELAPLPAAPAG